MMSSRSVSRLRKSILFVTANETAPAGASETTWASAARKLRASGLDIWCSAKWWQTEPDHIKTLRELGCKIHLRSADPVARQPWELPFAERNFGILDMACPGLAVISQGDNWEGAGWALRCIDLNIPFVLICNSASDWHWPDDELSGNLRIAYGKARRAYFVSPQNAQLTELQIGMRLSNAVVTDFPCNVPYNIEVPALEPSDSLRLACVARLHPPSKGQDLLFQILGDPKWRTRPVSVDLFGAGPHERVLRDLAALLKLDCVQFCGYVDNIESIWESHHALILPSREEGFPAAIVEAAFCGRPSIVTDIAGNSLLIRDGFSGFVAESPSVPAISRALEAAWQQRDRMAEFGRNARILARKNIPPDPTEALACELADLALGR